MYPFIQNAILNNWAISISQGETLVRKKTLSYEVTQ